MLFLNATVLVGLSITGSKSLSPLLTYVGKRNPVQMTLNQMRFSNFFTTSLYAGVPVPTKITKSSFANFLNSAVVFDSCAIYNNQSLPGSRVVTEGNFLDMTLCNFSNCTSTTNGGSIMFNMNTQTILMTSTFIYNSSAVTMGGGAYCVTSSANISMCQFKTCRLNNAAPTAGAEPAGAGLYLSVAGAVIPDLTYNIYRDCGMNSSGYGGGAYLLVQDVDMQFSIFSSCFVVNATDGPCYGGGLYIMNSITGTVTTPPLLNLTFVEFTLCQAYNGSAVYIDGFDVDLSYADFLSCYTAPPTTNTTVDMASVVNYNVASTLWPTPTLTLNPVRFNDTLNQDFLLLLCPTGAIYGTQTAGSGSVYVNLPLGVGYTIDNFSIPALPVNSGVVSLQNLSLYTFTTAVWPYDVATFLDASPSVTPTLTITPSATPAALATVAIVFIVIACIIVVIGIILAVVLVARKGFGGPGGCCGRSYRRARGAKIVTYF